MGRYNFLLRSRHGVYYFRAVLPVSVRRCLGLTQRELRVSLHTKNLTRAKALVARKAYVMTHFLGELPWEQDAEKRKALYWHGLGLLKRFGDVDLDDEFQLDALTGELSGFDLEAYLFAQEHHRSQKPATSAGTVVSPPSLGIVPAAATQTKVLTTTSPTVQPVSVSAGTTDETVERALERFLEQKLGDADAATVSKYGSQIKLALKIVSRNRLNLKLSEITVDDFRAYLDAIRRLPRKTMPDDPRSVEELEALGGPRMAPKTLFAHAQATNMFFRWCLEQQYAVHPTFGSILKPLLKKPNNVTEDREKGYSTTHLQQIFHCRDYREGLFKRPSDFWLPLIALFTGAREAELCQLTVSDVRQDAKTSIWLFDINAKGTKKLKNRASKREVPIHQRLIALGLLDYVNDVHKRGEHALFPDEERNTRGEFSAFSKRYNRFKTKLGIMSDADSKLDFHSFRHTLSGSLIAQGADEYVVNAIVGHSAARSSESVSTYSKGVGIEAKRDMLLKLTYDVEFDAIKPNGWRRS